MIGYGGYGKKPMHLRLFRRLTRTLGVICQIAALGWFLPEITRVPRGDYQQIARRGVWLQWLDGSILFQKIRFRHAREGRRHVV